MTCKTRPSKRMRGGGATAPSGGVQDKRAHLTGSFNCVTHPVLGRALSSLDGPSMWSGLDGYRRDESQIREADDERKKYGHFERKSGTLSCRSKAKNLDKRKKTKQNPPPHILPNEAV